MSAAEPDSCATVATAATARPPRRLAKVLRRFAVPLACTASAAGAALALSVLGWAGALGAAVASGFGGWALVRIGGRSHSRVAQEVPEARLGAQIVPVWQRTVEAAKTHSARSADTTLLESFANVSVTWTKHWPAGPASPWTTPASSNCSTATSPNWSACCKPL